MKVDVRNLGYREVNEKLREATGSCKLTGCLGQRFLAAGMSDKKITLEGVPGNALGAYLNGAEITVRERQHRRRGRLRDERRQNLRKRQCRIPCRHSYESLSG